MPDRAILESSFVLVGPGRAGMAMARSWIRAGGAVAGVVGRTRESAARAARQLATSATTARTAPARCDVLVLAVPDDRIAAVAEDLAARTSCRIGFHLSGALPASVLAPLARRGASVASLHPLRAFTGDSREDWHGALVAIEGDAEAVEAGERLTAVLGGSAHRIRTESKPLYHAAATLAAGGTMALLSIAVRAAVDAGLPEEQARAALARLASEAALATADRPFREAFTGPIARRDVETVRAHCSVSAGRRDFFDLYRRFAQEILATTPGRGKEEEIRAILKEADGGEPRPAPRERGR